ncbi:unnamed protein product [Citrullus colocynthis]|uniref:Uncharacterized protein n=1 Tax=Citrullus colocynthis TaxID=252529 RepID=A0ABP0YNH9_9ROSI
MFALTALYNTSKSLTPNNNLVANCPFGALILSSNLATLSLNLFTFVNRTEERAAGDGEPNCDLTPEKRHSLAGSRVRQSKVAASVFENGYG